MSYDLDKRLVIGLASSALFDLVESDHVFRTQGEAEYKKYQLAHETEAFAPGVAFPFIKRLLALNDLSPDDPVVEVMLLSRNDPNTGMRVMNSIQHYGLDISRAIFLQGADPYPYIPALSISLFLSANERDVRAAVQAGYPAGQVLRTAFQDDYSDPHVRVAFDFDGVIIDDEAEQIYQAERNLQHFMQHETERVRTPHNPGLLQGFLTKLSRLQALEQEKQQHEPKYQPRLRIAIVTARNAPAHERLIYTMRSWGIDVNEAFFLGGVEKRRVLEVLQPHIFFDDQAVHLESAAHASPSVHIPFGKVNSKQSKS
ncbi:5'-nucleotidase [Alcaligenes endophyticus]|uniref:5'-nucleotidase n=1 Tax=Alcaligenes endophyticus TaxID=1929088 RepID=A0ABT8EF00_9BURK|nr:5'-nucleotidase [Alcaligenes endophyticus]MCX5590479.1 5'-nucleotidase [Alcaligenes endophyticus]MDN4119857.1 5'-nucleotidase [Alcaligenes endophyticus]